LVYARPVRLDEALRQLAGGARVIAGATDLFPAAGERPLQGDFVDITGIPKLRGVSREGQSLRFGAATTWDAIVRSDLPPAFAALQAAAREVGAKSVQTRATIGGNLCNASPAADGVPPLLALDAELELLSVRGRRRLPLEKFLLGSRRTALARDEMLAAVLCPTPSATLRSTFLKLGARKYLVISIVMVAVALDVVDGLIRQARIAVGACSPVARRLETAEQKLFGAPACARLGEALVAEDFATLTPIDDVRASELYRREAALTLTRRAVAACLNGEAGGAV
jgi:CO/xanthine dehydrogenase FAD-binding subunit